MKNSGFKLVVEKPWSFANSPEFHRATFDGQELSLSELVKVAEAMRLKLLEFGYVAQVKSAEKAA